MVSVKNETNEALTNIINDLENRLNDSREVLSDIQEKMDSKVSEAKEYKVQVDDAKENIKRLEDEIKSLENDLVELKEKYSKKNLVAVIEAGNKEINHEIKKKQDEIQVYKNKIAELTNRARSIKDLLVNLKKDKKIKEERLKELENCTNYYKVRLEEVIKFAEEHDDLDDYSNSFDDEVVNKSVNVFDDIAEIEDSEENKESNIFDEESENISIDDTDEVFNDVINAEEEEEDESEDVNLEVQEELEESKDNYIEKTTEIDDVEEDLEDNHDLEINDLLTSVKEPSVDEKLANVNKAIDDEFANIFGTNINEPIKTMDIFGNEYVEEAGNENIVVNTLTTLGLDYYSFSESDREYIKDNFNEKIITEIIKVLNNNKIQLDNIYVDGKLLGTIAPRELDTIIGKLIGAGQSEDAIGYILDKLPLVDIKKLDETIVNYGDYIKNVEIVDIIIKSLKGEN